MSNIHDLPKDIVIKLLTTIERDTKNTTEKQLFQQLLIAKLWNFQTAVVKCEHEDCKEFVLTSYDMGSDSPCIESCTVGNAKKSIDVISVPIYAFKQRELDSGLICVSCIRMNARYACKEHVAYYFDHVFGAWYCHACDWRATQYNK
jgi:hypothetical protein